MRMVIFLGRSKHVEDIALLSSCGACSIQSDCECALHALETVFELDCKKLAPFLILANMYALDQELDTVAQYRKCLVQ